jgi:hypothetical protein
MWKAIVASLGAVGTAVGSALCCAGPLVAVALGMSGAGLAATFEPLRPYFVGATAAFLSGGFWILRREERASCEPDKPCASPQARRVMRIALWTATGIAAVLATFPIWSAWLLN